jgi:hypothetical protein
MRHGKTLVAFAVLILPLLATASNGGHRLVDRWRNPDFESREFRNLLVIGIADLTEERKQFENKFVSHLRSRDIDGVTSYSIVPRLDQPVQRDKLVRQLDEMGVDGAITVRLVPLKSISETEWAIAWDEQMDRFGTIRELIDETLPIENVKSKEYGVEVALWEGTNWTRVWGARTNSYKRKQLADASGDFVQFTMRALRDALLIQ